jgi:hypothetical protein
MRSPVIVVGPLAFKFARNEHGRASNIYEAKLYRSTNETRRALLCPALWVSSEGTVLIMRAAQPLGRELAFYEYSALCEAWTYMSGEDCCPFERKESDWGWFKGRLVALDYSTPAWVCDEDE